MIQINTDNKNDEDLEELESYLKEHGWDYEHTTEGAF